MVIFETAGIREPVGLVLSVIGSLALGFLPATDVSSFARLVSPTWDHPGYYEDLEHAVRDNTRATFGFIALSIGLGFLLVHHFTTTSHTASDWVLIVLLVGFGVGLSWLSARLIAYAVKKRVEAFLADREG